MSKKNTTTESARKNGTSSCARYRFSGHQTFVARNGWLEKGVNLILNNPHGFLDNDAVVRLGVGKNMVESIKYWCQQTGLVLFIKGDSIRIAYQIGMDIDRLWESST